MLHVDIGSMVHMAGETSVINMQYTGGHSGGGVHLSQNKLIQQAIWVMKYICHCYTFQLCTQMISKLA